MSHPDRCLRRSESTPVFLQPTFLMCPPKLYDVNYVINPWMAGNVRGSSREQAAKQWGQLCHALGQVALVMQVEPEPGRTWSSRRTQDWCATEWLR